MTRNAEQVHAAGGARPALPGRSVPFRENGLLLCGTFAA
jgi:hypothetical protein